MYYVMPINALSTSLKKMTRIYSTFFFYIRLWVHLHIRANRSVNTFSVVSGSDYKQICQCTQYVTKFCRIDNVHIG